jgi:hypothetical protein
MPDPIMQAALRSVIIPAIIGLVIGLGLFAFKKLNNAKKS